MGGNHSDSVPATLTLASCFLRSSASKFNILAEMVMTVLFKKSLAEGVVPEDWKRANVSPIYKKGIKTSQRTIDQ